MPRVPRKNISWRISDIKKAKARGTVPQIPAALKNEKPSEPPIISGKPVYRKIRIPRRNNNKLIRAWLVLVIICLGGGIAWYRLRGVESLPGDNLPSAAPPPSDSQTSSSVPGDYSWQGFSVFTSQMGEALGSLKGVTSGFLAVAGELNYLEANGLNLFLGNQGSELIAHLEKTESSLKEMYDNSEIWQSGSGQALGIGPGVAPGQLLDMHFALGQASDFLSKLIPWLKEAKDRKIILLLENPSELRPGGGFLGSYAELTITQGGLKDIKVYDINEPDRKITTKTIPPRPLQAIVGNWRAADANWFFDFSDSARKTAQFLLASDMYKGISIDGIVGLSARAMQDILNITGPIQTLAGKEISASNFLSEIQKEVEAGQQAGDSQPKKILQELAPIIIQKLSRLDSEGKSNLANSVLLWLADRDLRVYWSDPDFQKFFSEFDLAGEMYSTPRNFNGDYLAVVDANVGGGKTDLKIAQDVKVETQITSDGWINDHLVLTRKDQAKSSDAWWYQVANKSQIQILTGPGSIVSYADGGTDQKIYPRLNYTTEGYQKDPGVSAMESEEEVLPDYPTVRGWDYQDKKVFSTWQILEPGQSGKITLDFGRRAITSPQEGMKYDFILEKQSGSTGSYFWQITAPVGFKFKENNLPVYEYKTEDLPGRWTVSLTLEKI